MAPAAPKNGTGWAVGALKWIVIAAVGYLIAVNTFLVRGHFIVEKQGSANELAIKQINEVLSDRARADMAAAAAERRRLEAQIFALQGQQRQERQTQEAPGRPAPSSE